MENASRRIWKWSRTSGKNAAVAWPPRPEPNKNNNARTRNDNAPNKNDNAPTRNDNAPTRNGYSGKQPRNGPNKSSNALNNWPRNYGRWVSTQRHRNADTDIDDVVIVVNRFIGREGQQVDINRIEIEPLLRLRGSFCCGLLGQRQA